MDKPDETVPDNANWAVSPMFYKIGPNAIRAILPPGATDIVITREDLLKLLAMF